MVVNPAAVEKATRAGLPFPVEVEGETIEVPPEELTVERIAAEGWSIAESQGFFVALATGLTPELEREGRVRDLVRQIQNLRKEIGLEVDDRIRVTWAADATSGLGEDVAAHADYIAAEILAVELVPGEVAEGHGVRVAGGELRVAIAKA